MVGCWVVGMGGMALGLVVGPGVGTGTVVGGGIG